MKQKKLIIYKIKMRTILKLIMKKMNIQIRIIVLVLIYIKEKI